MIFSNTGMRIFMGILQIKTIHCIIKDGVTHAAREIKSKKESLLDQIIFKHAQSNVLTCTTPTQSILILLFNT